MPRISLICPVYNAEQYLSKCLDSILAQTFKDWELIIVIDGSPDRSENIAETYARRDSRIRVIHQANKGVSAARQVGQDACSGEYVIHVDPDDWMEPPMLEELSAEATMSNADVVICDYYITYSNGVDILRQQRPSEMKASVVLRELFVHLHGSCWNKLVRRACLQKFGIRFPEGISYCEDFLTWVQLFQHDDVTISYQPQAFYHYVQHTDSLTNNYTRQTYERRLEFLRLLKEYLPGESYANLISKTEYTIFREACFRGLLSTAEVWSQSWKYRRHILSNQHGMRDVVAYAILLIGGSGVVRKLYHVVRVKYLRRMQFRRK